MAAMTNTPPLMPSAGLDLRPDRGRGLRTLTLTPKAERPVQDAGGVGCVDGVDGTWAVQGHGDDGVTVPDGLEQQALPSGPGVSGLDADRARIVAEQRVEVRPQVGMVPGSGGDPVSALVHDRAEDRGTHRGAAEGEQVRCGGIVRVLG